MAEHGLDGSQRVLGFAFDGTGYGPDGAIWGGEVLLADYKGYQRLAQLKYVPLAGGDVSVLRPYRMALSHLWAAGLAWDRGSAAGAGVPRRRAPVLLHQLETGLGCAPTSSMGRLFDAVSALVGVRQVVATRLRRRSNWRACRATPMQVGTRYAFGVDSSPTFRRSSTPLPFSRAIVDDLRAGYVDWCDRGEVPPSRCRPGRRPRRAWRTPAARPIALSGGVFQNALLLRLALDGLRAKGFRVITHRPCAAQRRRHRTRSAPGRDGGMTR